MSGWIESRFEPGTGWVVYAVHTLESDQVAGVEEGGR